MSPEWPKSYSKMHFSLTMGGGIPPSNIALATVKEQKNPICGKTFKQIVLCMHKSSRMSVIAMWFYYHKYKLTIHFNLDIEKNLPRIIKKKG